MNSILKKICDYKKNFIIEQKKIISEDEMILNFDKERKKRGFKKSVDLNFDNNKVSVIAEIKKASPSKGIMSKIFNPIEIAKSYQRGGATCISVLTDEKYFLGSTKDLIDVRKNCDLPIIRKDFIISEYQIIESKYVGADCILLIYSILKKQELINLYKLAIELDLDILIEVHDKEELLNVIDIEHALIGVNNRNLNTMKVDINNSIYLKSIFKKDKNLICESGIKSINDIKKLLKYNYKSFLIGEYFMKSPSPEKELQNILRLTKEAI